MFLCEIERVVGRDAFSRWLRSYLDAYRFGAITTEEFEAHIEAALPGALAKANARAWIDGEGVPSTAKPASSAQLATIELLASSGKVPTAEQTKGWTPIEWALYLESVPRPAPAALCQGLDDAYRLTASTNFDVLVPWLTLALKSGYAAVMPRVEQVVAEVGRMKYLRPLYTALAADPRTRDVAASTFARNLGHRWKGLHLGERREAGQVALLCHYIFVSCFLHCCYFLSLRHFTPRSTISTPPRSAAVLPRAASARGSSRIAPSAAASPRASRDSTL